MTNNRRRIDPRAVYSARLGELEARYGRPEVSPGQDPRLLSRRDLLCLCFGVNLSDAEVALLPNVEIRAHMAALMGASSELIAALKQALNDGSADWEPLHNRHVQMRLDSLLWMKNARDAAVAADLKGLRDSHQRPMNYDLWGA